LEAWPADRGKEFACFPTLEARGVPVYFADPYAAGRRGTNENTNGLLQEFFLKGMDLARLSQQEVDYVASMIHHRPRNCLHGKTTEEAFQEEVFLLN
jgi:IS30 family transposase